ncbi:hypothetical protein [Oceanirhabdus sp. W0125-5]|uniref:hypothetical protein n=1 Tax=Oceanirhabdus sp. W0125-5 TaxID=2999116 RepID=UPI0022F346B2|nr:hypothetical protein [Oceanirhabdus sp. W0125-5]WBW95297.1 hypothetical protein OW730_16565 [Oceanirhabdus sp. W0125-5]
MKNKKESGTLENNLSNNAMMMDHVLGSSANPFKERQRKRKGLTSENQKNNME